MVIFFSHLIIISIFINWHSTVKESFPFAPIYLFIYLYQHGSISIDFIYSMGCNLLLSLFILLLRLPLVWPMGALKLASVFYWPVPLNSLSSSFLTRQDIPGSPCIFPHPALELTISPKNDGSFSHRMIFENQDLDAMCVHYYWVIKGSTPF